MKNSTKYFLIAAGIILAVGGGISFILFAFIVGMSDREDVTIGRGDKVAVVELDGVILNSEETVRQLKKYREDRSIKAIVFRVDSPGGGVVASQEIYEEAKRTRKSGKPIVASMGSLAASGGYYVSCGASRIVANPGTLTGSIGVISQFMQFDTLMRKFGVTMNTIKSGKLKDAGNPFRSMSGEDRKYFQGLMDDVHRQFIDVVERERSIDHDSVLSYADGRVFTGEEAVHLHLVDTLGTFEDAIHIAAALAGIRGEPSIVRERKRKTSILDFFLDQSKIPDFLGLKESFGQPILQYRMAQGF